MTIEEILAATLLVAGIVLGTLKLSGSIAWSWWLVLAPLYPIAAYAAWIGFCILLAMWVFRDGM